jgi:aspartate aminotransferase-like enzyme
MIEEYGGKRWFFNLYKNRNEKIVKGVNGLGLSLFPQKGFESPTVNCIKAPEGVEGTIIYDAMRNEGFELAKGYGELSKKTFRIGNMGYIEENDIGLMLDSLSRVLGKL